MAHSLYYLDTSYFDAIDVGMDGGVITGTEACGTGLSYIFVKVRGD